MSWELVLLAAGAAAAGEALSWGMRRLLRRRPDVVRLVGGDATVALAKQLYLAYRRHRGERGDETPPWDDLSAARRARWLGIAKHLLSGETPAAVYAKAPR